MLYDYIGVLLECCFFYDSTIIFFTCNIPYNKQFASKRTNDRASGASARGILLLLFGEGIHLGYP